MKIVFLGNFNVDYSSENHHKRSLEALGHTVIAMQEGEARSEDILRQAMGAQMFVWVHTHGWATRGRIPMYVLLNRLKSMGIPTVTYHLDLWFGLNRQRDLGSDPIYRYIQHFFTVDKQMADWFNTHTSVKGHYLPAGVFGEEAYMAEPSGDKVYDVLFVGSKGYHPEWPYRPKLINWLKETYGDRFTHVGGDGELPTTRGHALNQLYADSKVVVGDTLCIGFDYPYYWSDRVYETLGRGGFMIHPQITGLQDEFSTYDFKVDDDGFIDATPAPIELVTYEYNNFNMLRERIDYFLENDRLREEIRRNGHERVKNNYTYVDRWRYIIEVVFNAQG